MDVLEKLDGRIPDVYENTDGRWSVAVFPGDWFASFDTREEALDWAATRVKEYMLAAEDLRLSESSGVPHAMAAERAS